MLPTSNNASPSTSFTGPISMDCQTPRWHSSGGWTPETAGSLEVLSQPPFNSPFVPLLLDGHPKESCSFRSSSSSNCCSLESIDQFDLEKKEVKRRERKKERKKERHRLMVAATHVQWFVSIGRWRKEHFAGRLEGSTSPELLQRRSLANSFRNQQRLQYSTCAFVSLSG